MTSVGIDGVSIWTGKLQLDLPGTFAPAKGEEPDKYRIGLGLYESSLPDVHEDIVTMGANAAYELMTKKGLEPTDIGRIDVATESAFDHSKPVSTYIAGCLEQVFEGDFHHANKGERKFACISGTQSLDDAFNWIRAGRNRGRSALVIATDTALYERDDPGEATQGAGALAMLVSEEPSVVELSTEQGYGSADETDFLKPNQQFPSVDGKRSIQVYLARMREALEDFESVWGDTHPDDFRFFPFHTPFPGMVRRAALLGYRHTIRGTDVAASLEGEIGPMPTEADYETFDDFQAGIREYMDDLAETDTYREWYERCIEPTLTLARRVGNWYTGSVHLARASALLHAADVDEDLTGERLLVGSYGSGAQAEIHAETVREGWQAAAESLDIESRIEDRYDLSFTEYEAVHDAHNHERETDLEEFTTPSEEFVFTGWGRMGERKYEFVG